MNIKDVMTPVVGVVSPDAALHEVAEKMQQLNAGCVLVSESDRLVGVITDRDLAIRCVAAAHHPAGTTARQIMSSEVLYCLDTDLAKDVARNMALAKVRFMVVLDADKHMVGIVSLGNLSFPRVASQDPEADPREET